MMIPSSASSSTRSVAPVPLRPAQPSAESPRWLPEAESTLNPDRRFLLAHIQFDKPNLRARTLSLRRRGQRVPGFLAQYGAVKRDFIGASLAQNITMEGMAYPIYRYEIKYWSRFDPSLSRIIRGAFGGISPRPWCAASCSA